MSVVLFPCMKCIIIVSFKIHSIPYLFKYTQSNLYIKGTQKTLKMCPLWAVALYIQVKRICTIHSWEK